MFFEYERPEHTSDEEYGIRGDEKTVYSCSGTGFGHSLTGGYEDKHQEDGGYIPGGWWALCFIHSNRIAVDYPTVNRSLRIE